MTMARFVNGENVFDLIVYSDNGANMQQAQQSSPIMEYHTSCDEFMQYSLVPILSIANISGAPNILMISINTNVNAPKQ